MRIGELSKLSGVAVETIRFYENEGPIPKAARSMNNYRSYTEGHLKRLQFIRHCRSLDMSLEDIKLLSDVSARQNEEACKVQEIIKIAQEPVSLESPIGEEEDSHLGDFLEDDKTPPPSQIVAESMMKQTLSDVLHMLTPREEQVIRMRYGLDDGQQRTLEEVGKAFNVTRERIRQIEVKALRKIKRPNMSKNLVDYMD